MSRFGQKPELSSATGMALVRCILGKFLGVVCHCFPPHLDFPLSPPGASTTATIWEILAAEGGTVGENVIYLLQILLPTSKLIIYCNIFCCSTNIHHTRCEPEHITMHDKLIINFTELTIKHKYNLNTNKCTIVFWCSSNTTYPPTCFGYLCVYLQRGINKNTVTVQKCQNHSTIGNNHTIRVWIHS